MVFFNYLLNKLFEEVLGGKLLLAIAYCSAKTLQLLPQHPVPHQHMR